MYSKPMTNDSDRVAPDRRIHLPTPTPMRPRRRIAAAVLSLLLALSCFAASPAWAVKLGEGADDTPPDIPEFNSVNAYLVDGDRDSYIDVKIKHSSSGTEYTYTLKRRHLDKAKTLTPTNPNTLTPTNLIKRYSSAQAYITARASGIQAYLYAYLENKDKVYLVTDLEAHNTDDSPLSDDNLPDPVEETPGKNTAIGVNASATEYSATAIGVNARATNRGAVAIGQLSRSSGWKSIAIGSEANATDGIAMGRNARANWQGIALGRYANANGGISLGNGANSVSGATAVGNGANAATGATAVGGGSWAPGLHGSTAVGGASHATGERSTALGSIAKAGGSHGTAVGEASEAQGSHTVAVGKNAIAGLRVGKTYNDVAAYLRDRTIWTSSTTYTHVRIGNKVYKVTALDAFSGLTDDKRPPATTVNAGGVAVGVNARATGMNSIALGRNAWARETGGIALGYGAEVRTRGIALGHDAEATGTEGIAIGSGVSAAQNEVVIGGAKGQHTYKLPGLVKSTHTSGTRVVTVDSLGRLSTQAATSSPDTDNSPDPEPSTDTDKVPKPSQSASLRGAAVLSSEVTPLNRDIGTRTDAADYEKAPAIGSGPEAPETAGQRRVVVQDTNRDGSVRLRTLDFGDLSGVDRRLAGVEQRVTSLGDRLNKATAMSAALSALPNVVPGDNRFFLGVGAGHYSSEQALAIGMSARVGRHVFVNAGAALASGDDASVRGGVGVVW